MIRRRFLDHLAGMLGGLVGLGGEPRSAVAPVSCPDCGRPSLPRRRHEDATEYVCLDCAVQGQWPLAAYMFTRKANDPNYFAFFPAAIDALLVPGTKARNF